ncbi:hypothetical protein EC988_009919, partial [Linderina pennispora]
YDLGTCPMAQMATDIAEDVAKPLLTVVNGTLDGEIPEYVLKNAPYDYIASSLVLCSVTDIEANIENIDFLLAPGGKFVFIEHVRHGDHDPQVEAYDISTWRTIQDWLTPVWSVIAGNCHLDRETGKALDQFGNWETIQYKTTKGGLEFFDKFAPLIYGVATKARK